MGEKEVNERRWKIINQVLANSKPRPEDISSLVFLFSETVTHFLRHRLHVSYLALSLTATRNASGLKASSQTMIHCVFLDFTQGQSVPMISCRFWLPTPNVVLLFLLHSHWVRVLIMKPY